MNRRDRKRLADMADILDGVHEALEEMHYAEDDKFNNLADGVQESEKGQAIANASDSLEEVAEDLREVVDKLRALAEPAS